MSKSPNATRKTRNPGGFLIGNILGACIVQEIYGLDFSLWFNIPALAYALYFMVRVIATTTLVLSDAKRLREAEAARVAASEPSRATAKDVR